MMVDRISPEHRSWNMSRIRGKETKPEVVLRSLMHRAGFRYRLYDKKLPGTPDLILPKHNTAIFVNGCYWHRHEGCQKATTPKSNTTFWTKKFEETVERDVRKKSELIESGWRVIVIWECELETDPVGLVEGLSNQLEGGRDG
ncbi:MAG: DNA mismatch endonuclease Vsr [Rhodobacteraceae bacterium]|nr:DNA mismatch endonuclease Vsr [Paracoccaceae bacterium]